MVLIFQRLVICLADQYHIHNIRDMQVLHILKGASSNPSGLFALSIANDTGYVAYPGSDSMGCLEIFDSMSMVCPSPVVLSDVSMSM